MFEFAAIKISFLSQFCLETNMQCVDLNVFMNTCDKGLQVSSVVAFWAF